MRNEKGFTIIEWLIVFVIVLILATTISSRILKMDERVKETVKEKAAEEQGEFKEESKKIEKYMVIVRRDSGPYDTLYTNRKGVIEEIGDLVIYTSEDFRIISKSTILEIPIRDKYSDMDEYGSGIDLDDY